jgi:type II secretory pathway pseudopilin PulG
MKFKLSSLKLQNNKGLTLIELLAIVVILGILIAASLSYVNNSFDKARGADVQHVFENYRDNATILLQDAASKPVTLDDFNAALDPALKITATTPAIKMVGTSATKSDPWNHPYRVAIHVVTFAVANVNVPAQTQVVISSDGKDGVKGTSDDFYQVVYYSEGNTDTATKGFNKNDIKLGVFALGTGAACLLSNTEAVTEAAAACTAPTATVFGTVGFGLIAK